MLHSGVPNDTGGRIRGKPPPPRGGHVAGVLSSKLVIFGGQYRDPERSKFVTLGDLRVLDLPSLSWETVRVSDNADKPCARYHAAAAVCCGRMHVFGGRARGGHALGEVVSLQMMGEVRGGCSLLVHHSG